MGKVKSEASETRRSARIAQLKPAKAPVEVKKRTVKKPTKAKKEKPAENGSTKSEEPKADAAEAK